MRNLYSKLNIDPSASADEIRSAINSCSNASLRADASKILLNPERREAYDSLNSVLIDIGYLRAELGLSHTDNWQGEEASEYTQTPKNRRPLYKDFVAKIRKANLQVKIEGFVSSFRKFIKGLGYSAIVIALLIGIVSFLEELDKQPSSNNKKTEYTETRSSKYGSSEQANAKEGQEGPSDSHSTSQKQKDQSAQVPVKKRAVTKPDNVKSALRQPPLPLPESKKTRLHTSKQAIAPFRIETSEGVHYFIKLENSSSGQDVMDIFVRGGDNVEIEVPLGRFIVKYATGSHWYGYKYYFGPETNYSKADKVFHFKQEGNYVSGYTLVLYPVIDGNLRTESINPDQF